MDYSKFKQLEFRRKFLKIFGAEIVVSDPASGQEIGIIQMKAWKFKEDIRLYTDRSQQQEVLAIHARSVIDFGATYDVLDSKTAQPVFALRRKGLKSTFVRDHWNLLDNSGNEFGFIQETSSGLAIARRWLEILPFGDIIGLIFSFAKQTYTINVNDASGNPALVGTILHRKNPFIVKMSLDTSMAQTPVDYRLTIAAVSLLSVIDATKNS